VHLDQRIGKMSSTIKITDKQRGDLLAKVEDEILSQETSGVDPRLFSWRTILKFRDAEITLTIDDLTDLLGVVR
jgi:gluconate kinase